MVATHGFINPIVISSHTGIGIEELRATMLHSLFGPQRTVMLHPGGQDEPAIESLLSRFFDSVYVHSHRREGDFIEVRISASDETLAILQSTYGERIELK
jgi:50S ribosomal subunit-associated GTPase HflX